MAWHPDSATMSGVNSKMKRLLRSTTILLVVLHRLLITNSVVCVCVSLHIQQHDATSEEQNMNGERRWLLPSSAKRHLTFSLWSLQKSRLWTEIAKQAHFYGLFKCQQSAQICYGGLQNTSVSRSRITANYSLEQGHIVNRTNLCEHGATVSMELMQVGRTNDLK